MSEVTQVISAIEQGDPAAAQQLLPLVYEELRRLAAARLAHERPGQTLQPTALVHEAWLRLAGPGEALKWNGRAHFFGAAAEAMRRILVEQARHKQTEKAGGRQKRSPLCEVDVAEKQSAVDPVLLSDALDVLATAAPRAAEIVKLRFFGGLTLAEAANVLNVAPSTADADWAYAKSWLRVQMQSKGQDAEG